MADSSTRPSHPRRSEPISKPAGLHLKKRLRLSHVWGPAQLLGGPYQFAASRSFFRNTGPDRWHIDMPFPTLRVFEPAAPSILLQTVIIRGHRTNEGTFIEAVALPWFTIIALLNNDPDIAYQLPPEKWEEIIAGVYKQAGFDEVILTPRSGDLGRDVIATK